MIPEQKLKNKIMRRVYAIWFARKAAPLALGSAVFLYIALAETARRFFVAKVISNFLEVSDSSIWSAPRFIASALNHVEPSILIVISLAGLISFILAVKLLRSIRSVVANQNMGMIFGHTKK